MHTIKPLGPRVLVRPEAPEQATASGIILPPQAQEAPLRGEILAKGSGFKAFTSRSLDVGDTVLYQRYGTTEIDADGETLLIVPEEHLLAILERAADKPAGEDDFDDEDEDDDQ